jgi:uncharacterized protein YeaO (DUF488 family)
MSKAFRVARIYHDHSSGYRVLVDRLWPRGLKKEDAGLDEWLKDIAPSTDLRKWYGHEPERFAEFARRYHAELRHSPASEAVAHLRDVADKRTVILLTATKEVDISAAAVLHDYLEQHSRR